MSVIDAATWMARKLTRTGELYQDDTVSQLASQFGAEMTYINDSGNDAIACPVLKAFRKLTEKTAVWDRGERCWRLRQKHDQPGRQQD